ncbi:MAG: sodium:solute symporter, partial [Victivallaceae bacterium]
SGYQVAAKSAHEAKMANLLGSWRGVTQWIIMIVIPITAFAVMHSPEYAAMAAEVDASLGDLRNPQLKQQMIVPMVLTRLLPIGLTGLFVAVMLAAMISTDNTYMHSWGSIFIQDVIMPFRKKPFAPKTHLLVLRCSIVGVGVYAFFFSLFFRQTEHILLFWAITGAIFSGSGAAIVGGLYTRWGTASGATAALSIGAAISIGAILLQQYWRNFASLMFNAFPNWTFWVHNSEKMPVNGQVVWFFCLLSALISYVVFSLLSPARKRFDLRGMLHRDETGGAPAAELPWYQRLTGITAEFTFSDKIIAYAAIGWSLWWFTLFIAGQAAHFAGVLSDQMALRFWFWYFMLFFVLSFITTAWFSVAGLKDVAEMFKFLSGMKRNNADDGRVIDGKNAGE